MRSYLLAESTFIVQTTVNRVRDERLKGDVLEYTDEPVTTVSQGVAGDDSDGIRNLESPRRGDHDVTIAWTGDRRLASVSYKSVGVGSKVVAAGAKLLATIVGTAIRTAPYRQLVADDSQKVLPPSLSEVRAVWDAENESSSAHKKTYVRIADAATAELASLREQAVDGRVEVAQGVKILARTRQLEQILETALKEIAKIDAMFAAWSEARITRFQQSSSYAVALDKLPEHADPNTPTPQTDPDSITDPTLKNLWTGSGVWLEVGPSSAGQNWKPNPDGTVPGDTLKTNHIYWRLPRTARLWIWRAGVDGKPLLERTVDVAVTDRYSASESIPLDGRFFGEASVEIIFDDLGLPSKVVQGDTSVAGAIADALGGVTEQVSAGLTAASTIGTSVDGLREAADKRRLEVITRQVDQRAKELELQGINATADSYAELKRLQQQVEIASAQGSLAPASALSQLQDELAEATARRDLAAVNRETALAVELAEIRAEIARLQAQQELLKAAGG